MNVANEITHLREQIVSLEEEKKRLSVRIEEMKGDYLLFKSTYDRSIEEVYQKIDQLGATIQTLRQQLSDVETNVQEEEVLEPTSEAQPEPIIESRTEPQPEPQAEPLKETIKEEQAAPRPDGEEPFTLHDKQKANTTQQESASVFDKLSDQLDASLEKMKSEFDMEKFIGENLISKIGILILLIGVVIGGKYAFDHQLISPAMRIIIGTLIGFALQGVAYKLRPQYENFSAILASGSVATLYFMTFFAYHLYDLIPMPLAFALMTIITGATVWLAWSYNREIIALIGLVGAYVIPFLLGDNDNNHPWVLLSYIAIINIGVLIISVKKYWRILFVSSFVATWGIIGVLYRSNTWASNADTIRMLLFQAITFATFYATFLAYKIRRCLFFQHFDILFLLSNSFTFYGLGYNLLYNSEHLSGMVGWFTLLNAIIHAGVCFLMYKRNVIDQALRRLIAGLAISFLTIALLVWMTGHWLTIFWILEAAVLFCVARLSKRPFYERMSYPIFVLALISLIIDWGNPNGGHLQFLTPLFEAFTNYRNIWDVTPEANTQGHLLSIANTVLFILISGLVVFIDHRYPSTEENETYSHWMKLYAQGLSIMSIFVVTAAFLVHLDLPWFILMWGIEAVALCFFGRKKSNRIFEWAAYIVLGLELIASPWALSELNPYNLDYRSDHIFEFSLSFKEMWQSILVFLTIAASCVGQLYAIPRTAPLQGVAEAKKLQPILRTVLFFVVLCTILFHTQWFVTTTLLLSVAAGAFFWTKYHNREHIGLFGIALGLSMLSFIFDLIAIPTEGYIWQSSLIALLATATMAGLLLYDRQKPTVEINVTKIFLRVFMILIPYITLLLIGVEKIDVGFESETIFVIGTCYTMLYFSLIAFLALNRKWERYISFPTAMLCFAMAAFVTYGLPLLFTPSRHFDYALDNAVQDQLLHYGCLAIFLWSSWVVLCYYRKHKVDPARSELVVLFDSLLYIGATAIISYEIAYIGNLWEHKEAYGLVMSIFWGISALFAIYYGLYKEKKHLRVEGIVLISITLLKLFFYDIAHYSTVAKTIAFISLGILLLIISFTYQKIAKAKEKEKEKEIEKEKEKEEEVEINS